MEHCGSLRVSDRPSISQICAALRLIVERAEDSDAEQYEVTTPSLALPRRRSRRAIVQEEDDQLSTEMDEEDGGGTVLSRSSSSASATAMPGQLPHDAVKHSGNEAIECPLCLSATCSCRAKLAHHKRHSPNQPDANAAPSDEPTAELEAQKPPKRARTDSPASSGLDQLEQTSLFLKRQFLSADGERAANFLADRFPADGHGWTLPVWTHSFWQKLPPHIQQEVSSVGQWPRVAELSVAAVRRLSAHPT